MKKARQWITWQWKVATEWIVDWLATCVFGASVHRLLKNVDLRDRLIESQKNEIIATWKAVEALKKLNKLQEYQVNRISRAKDTKQKMINHLRMECRETRIDRDGWQEQSETNKRFFGAAIALAKKNEKEYRRRIKCLRENVRARNIRITKLKETGLVGKIREANKNLFNLCGELRSENYKAKRKIEYMKKTIASLMEK